MADVAMKLLSRHDDGDVRGYLCGFRRRTCRQLVVGLNVAMICIMYLEYLWAADWQDPDLDLCSSGWSYELGDLMRVMNCCTRYTFSDAMMRGRNLEIFAAIGTCVSVTYIKLESDRVKYLRALLVAERRRASDERLVDASLLVLDIFSWLTSFVYLLVLSLAPFHLGRPFAHYVVAGCCWTTMFTAISLYIGLPLQFEGTDSHGELAAWAARRRPLLPTMWGLLGVHIVTGWVGMLHVATRTDSTGLLFGLFEVSLILCYQVFVAIFCVDDDFVCEAEPCTKAESTPVAAAGSPLCGLSRCDTLDAPQTMLGS
eukprot:TRINITY_DN13701_c0_g2_i1.p1 TRINITY_DN13701_c0_g2~~TRINITY_DN13701_c0_g2_i1.p1  ORF type:complete len:314 (+),score=55.02 TRINITY_DN13701_c0_g2_i1:100-1041(+)